MLKVLTTGCALLFAMCAVPPPAPAQDLGSIVSFVDETNASKHNSVMVFGGRMSTTTLGSTYTFNLGYSLPGKPNFDNYIVGAAYRRDLAQFGHLTIGAEVGAADRFGHYVVCCDTQVMSSGIVQSGELWGGATLRVQLQFFNELRVTPGITVGFSGTNDSIGREREREITRPGNARFLGYLSPEYAFSSARFPNIELVYRVQHRSGAGGTFGHLDEGYNADVLGLRYHF